VSEEEKLTPDIIAAIDQHKAELAHLASLAHEHLKDCTTPDAPCPGESIIFNILNMPSHKVRQLLLVAIATAGKEELLWQKH
jgi:hypothetical protein